MRRSLRLLALACFVWGLVTLAGAGLAEESGVAIQLLAPREGATLDAGSVAEVAWAPGAEFSNVPDAEEWEAFLSLDGGATYPVRITPHLDQDLRRFRFQVPPFATQDARILLRFGDERRETAVELPARFAIVARLGLPTPAFLLSHPASKAGEPARPGSAGVVAWMEGSRRGGGLRQVVAAERASLGARLDPPKTYAEAAVLSSEPAPQHPLGPVPAGHAASPSHGRSSISRRAGTGPDRASNLLLLIQRQNE